MVAQLDPGVRPRHAEGARGDERRARDPRVEREGNWPDGLITHAASPLDDGNLVVTEVSDTPEDQATFMVQRLGGAVVRGGITSPPTAVIGTGLVAHHQLRG